VTVESADHEDEPPSQDATRDEVEGSITLDASFLEDVGLGRLSPAEANLVLAYVYDTLVLRVGTQLAEAMTEAQLDEFEAFSDAGDDDGALRWLQSNVPDYRTVVSREFDLVTTDLRQSAPLMLALVGLAP
jgi:hypothetical protein